MYCTCMYVCMYVEWQLMRMRDGLNKRLGVYWYRNESVTAPTMNCSSKTRQIFFSASV